jgi:ketosteroid isomerase-like protein
MLDAASLKRLAMLDRDQTEKRVREYFEDRQRGDHERVLAAMAPNVVYEVVGAWDLYPHSRRREGTDAIRAMLRDLHTNFETLDSVLHEIFMAGERVVVRRTVRLRHRGTNAVGNVRVINYLRFQEGMIIEFSEYPDTAATARLAGELEPV